MADCEGKSRAGKVCRYAARFPLESPRWCANCDPSPAAVERRARAGAMRRRRFTPGIGETAAGPDAPTLPKEPTVDYIVDLCLEAAASVRSGTLEPARARAAERLYHRALDGMKARGMVGDARVKPPEPTPPAKSSPSDDNPPPAGSLEELGRQLDA